MRHAFLIRIGPAWENTGKSPKEKYNRWFSFFKSRGHMCTIWCCSRTAKSSMILNPLDCALGTAIQQRSTKGFQSGRHVSMQKYEKTRNKSAHGERKFYIPTTCAEKATPFRFVNWRKYSPRQTFAHTRIHRYMHTQN
jgi:hypothetical protein